MTEGAHATAVKPAGSWDPRLETDQLLIEFDQRFRRRFLLRTVRGEEMLLDLPHAVRLRDGDGLVLRNGGIIRVCAVAEHLLEISAGDHASLMRIAWHLGNRHLPVQFVAASIRIRADHVIADMVTGLGGNITAIDAPFDPEAGAYAPGGHHHHHDEDATHGQ
jgi:urease accessory protein